MKCYECGDELIQNTGDLNLTNSLIGTYTLHSVSYSKCKGCGDIILSGNTWTAADEEERRIIKDRLEKLPVNEFISATETSNILGISKQALHKHHRIRKGFIFSVQHNGRVEYHRKSAELFKQTGDGRFPLSCYAGIEASQNNTRYILIPTIASPVKEYKEFKGEANLTRWFAKYSTVPTSQNGTI